MRCPKCDATCDDSLNRCNMCGQDLKTIRRVIRISNSYYNVGLERAKVRDLSGAVAALRKSLEFNKQNIDARNLLGLVLLEMGETVSALSEWVLSNHLQGEDNRAQYYINQIQANPSRLDSINQTIKKYNAALNSAKTNSADLAIIQLKKVVSLNPKFVRAHQLLALLYMKENEYGMAYKCLKRARKIDTTNTTTLRYVQEVSGHMAETGERLPRTRPITSQSKKDPLANVTPVGSYKEEKRPIMPVLYIVIGLFVGILISIVLIRPTIMNKGNSSSELSAMTEQLSVKNSELSKEKQNSESLQQQVNELQKKSSEGDTDTGKTMEAYEALIKGVTAYMKGSSSDATDAVKGFNKSDFKSDEAKSLFTTIGGKDTDTSDKSAESLFKSGRDKYNAGKLDQAIEDLEACLEVDPENQDALYFLGRVYQKKGDKDKAKEYYEKVIEVDKTSDRASEAKQRIKQVS